MNKGVFQMKKQTWKSIFLSLIAIFTLFLLGACGQQSVQKSYLQAINQEKKTDVRITLEHKGDKAISNQTTTTIYYKEAGVTKDQLKEMIDKYDEEYKDVKGFTHSAEYKDDYMVEKTTLNYEKADLDQLIEKKLVTTQKDKKVDYISFKSTFDMIEICRRFLYGQFSPKYVPVSIWRWLATFLTTSGQPNRLSAPGGAK